MRVAVLCAPESWYCRDLMRAGGTRHEVVAVPFSRIAARTLDKGVAISSSTDAGDRIDLATYDVVLVRTMPPGSLEQVVFRMDALGRLERAGHTLVVNPPRAIEMAVDKFLTTARLAEQGIPTPATVVCQHADEAMVAFEAMGQDIVLKPIFGSEGRGIARISDPAIALRTFRMLERLQAVLYVQQFIPHGGYDTRILFLGKSAFAMQRLNPDDWRTNVSRGAQGRPVQLTPELEQLARQAADVVGAPFLGVDVLTGLDGRQYVLEVNAVPGWKALARVTGIDLASQLLNFLETQLQDSPA